MLKKYIFPAICLSVGAVYAYNHRNDTQEVFWDMVVGSVVGAGVYSLVQPKK